MTAPPCPPVAPTPRRPPRHVHAGWLLMAIGSGLFACGLLWAIDSHDADQKHRWASHWFHQHDRFSAHITCMRTPGCDPMRYMPQSDPPEGN